VLVLVRVTVSVHSAQGLRAGDQGVPIAVHVCRVEVRSFENGANSQLWFSFSRPRFDSEMRVPTSPFRPVPPQIRKSVKRSRSPLF
jgi:hypothetical protein